MPAHGWVAQGALGAHNRAAGDTSLGQAPKPTCVLLTFFLSFSFCPPAHNCLPRASGTEERTLPGLTHQAKAPKTTPNSEPRGKMLRLAPRARAKTTPFPLWIVPCRQPVHTKEGRSVRTRRHIRITVQHGWGQSGPMHWLMIHDTVDLACPALIPASAR